MDQELLQLRFDHIQSIHLCLGPYRRWRPNYRYIGATKHEHSFFLHIMVSVSIKKYLKSLVPIDVFFNITYNRLTVGMAWSSVTHFFFAEYN